VLSVLLPTTRSTRRRRRTEKGKEYRIQTLISERRHLELQSDRQTAGIAELIINSAPKLDIMKDLENLYTIVENLKTVHDDLCLEVISRSHHFDVNAEERYLSNIRMCRNIYNLLTSQTETINKSIHPVMNTPSQLSTKIQT